MKKYIILVLLLNKVSITGRIGNQAVGQKVPSNTLKTQTNGPELITDQLNDSPLANTVAKSVDMLVKTGKNTQVLDYLRMKCQCPAKLPKKISSQLKQCGIISHHNENINPEISEAIKRYMETKPYFETIRKHQKQKLEKHIKNLNPAKKARFEQSIRECIIRNQNR